MTYTKTYKSLHPAPREYEKFSSVEKNSGQVSIVLIIFIALVVLFLIWVYVNSKIINEMAYCGGQIGALCR